MHIEDNQKLSFHYLCDIQKSVPLATTELQNNGSKYYSTNKHNFGSVTEWNTMKIKGNYISRLKEGVFLNDIRLVKNHRFLKIFFQNQFIV